MQRKFLTNLALLLFLNILVKPFYIFGVDVGVQNAVGADDYGIYFVVLNFSFLFAIILDLGITQFNNRNIAQNHQLLNKHFSSIVIVKLILGVTYFLITFIAALIIGYGSDKLYFLAFLAFNQFLLMMIQYLRSNISGLLMFKTDSLLSVMDRLLMIVICGTLLWSGWVKKDFQIEWFVYAQTFSYFITALIALTIVIKKAAFKRLHWNSLFIYSIIRKLYPFSILVFFMTIMFRVDSVILNKMLNNTQGDIQAGIYAHAYRLVDAFSNYALLFSVLLLPIFSKMIKQKENIENLARLAFSLLFTASVIISVNTYFFSFEITDLLYDKQIMESADLLKILMFSFIPISISYVFGTLLTANGSLKHLNYIYLIGVSLSIGLNILLIPELLALGSGIANLSSQAFVAISQVIAAAVLFKFKINFSYIIRIFLFGIIVIGLNLLSAQTNINWAYQFIGISVISFGISAGLKLLNLSDIIKIIKNKEKEVI